MSDFGMATDEQWAKMQKFIKSDKYKKEDFFVFETLGVGDRVVPNRHQRITKPALEVMAQDAQKGVSLMLNHNEGQSGVQSIPIGKVFDSRIGPGTQSGEETALYLTQYILRDDSKVDGYSKNDIINLIESGILEDTSVGFSVPFETATCNICHNKYFGGGCSHWQGSKYVVNEETGEQRTCILEINPPEFSEMHAGNVMLIEDSLVFDGAYSNAMIQQSKTGGITIETSNGLKVLNDKKDVKSDLIGFGTKNGLTLMYKPFGEKGGKLMNEEVNEVLENEEVTETVAEAIEETVEQPTEEVVEETAEETTEENVEETVEEATEEVEAAVEVTEEQSTKVVEAFSITEKDLEDNFGELKVTKDMLIALAKEGCEYKNRLIDEALESGVRAMGNEFNKESFRKSFELMSTTDIANAKDSFEQSVKAKFGNGRVSKVTEKKDEHNFEYQKKLDVSTLKTGNY